MQTCLGPENSLIFWGFEYISVSFVHFFHHQFIRKASLLFFSHFKDYEGEVLDLKKASCSFRRLDRPISVQTDARMQTVSGRYEELKSQQSEVDVGAAEDQRTLLCPAFHYPSFCSNEAIILHFLFRLIPYTFRLIQFQGNYAMIWDAFISNLPIWMKLNFPRDSHISIRMTY